MPPKPSSGDSKAKKVTEKSKKIVEDKTFGMKNKKGGKAQKFIQIVTKQVESKPLQGKHANAVDQNAERDKKKAAEAARVEELRALFKPVIAVQVVAKGVDPKSVVCVYFKQGTCQKGDRCKFSHDLSIERKAEKKNLYEDVRKDDTMADWDEAKLNEVVDSKHGEDNIIKRTTTEIVCKYFLEAVEKKTYGWFWSCPNGEKCMYRHALPPGFVLKSEAKAALAKKGEALSLEMLIEKERASLGKTVTKVTLVTFLAWKKRKIAEKKEEKIIAETKKQSNFKLGLHQGLSGRDLFTFNPDLVGDDDDGADVDYNQRDGEEGENGFECRDVKLSDFTEYREADETGTTATDDRFSYMDSIDKQERDNELACGGNDVIVEDAEGEESAHLNGDGDLTEKEHEESLKKMISPGRSSKNKKAVKDPTANIEIDESLFDGADLDDIDDELDNLEIEDE